MRALFSLSVLGLLASCSGKDPGPPGGSNPSTGGTTSTNPLTLECSPDPANQLRFECLVETADPEFVHFLWGPEGAVDEHHWPGKFATIHRMTVWGLQENTSYRVTAIGEAGQSNATITTGSLPTTWEPRGTITGASTGGWVLTELPCAPVPTLAVLGTDGMPVAYQEFPGTEFTSYEFTRDNTLLAVMDRDQIVEYDLIGNELLNLSASAGDFVGPVHRGVHRGLVGLTYALAAEEVIDNTQGFVVDRVLIFNPTGGQVGEWLLTDHLTGPLDSGNDSGSQYWATEWPGAIDYSQANALHADDMGNLLVSFGNLHTVMKINGNPFGTEFGQVIWRLSGGNHSVEPTDFTLTSTSGVTADLDFEVPQSIHLDSDGRLGLFDSRPNIGSEARGLFMDLDETGWTADIAEVFDLGVDCETGAAFSLEDGRRLLTCPQAGFAHEYEFGRNGPMWTLESSCAGDIPKVQPIELPWEILLE